MYHFQIAATYLTRSEDTVKGSHQQRQGLKNCCYFLPASSTNALYRNNHLHKNNSERN